MKVAQDTLNYYLEQCEDHVDTPSLTKWESDFITSLRDQFDRRGTMSERQAELLEGIYRKLPAWGQ